MSRTLLSVGINLEESSISGEFEQTRTQRFLYEESDGFCSLLLERAADMIDRVAAMTL